MTEEERAKEFEQKLHELCDEYHRDIIATVSFPQYAILPAEVQLANVVLKNHGGRLETKAVLRKNTGKEDLNANTNGHADGINQSSNDSQQ